MKFGKILSLYDYSAPSRAALHFAEALASRFRSRLGIVHVWEIGPTYLFRDWGHQAEPLQNILNRKLLREVQRLSKRKGKSRPRSVGGILAAGEPKAAIARVINDERPDLVVVGSHGRTGLGHILMGSVAEGVVRRSPAPVWVFRKPRRLPPKRILVPVDFDDASRPAVRAASELARMFSARLEIVHVSPAVENMAPFPEMRAYFPPNLTGDLRKRAQKRLERLAAGLVPSRISTGLHALTGSPAEAICRSARSLGADLIVIPTHARRGMARLVLGSVATGVVRHAPCSILTLPPKKPS
ncbi:MAG TPA: universal stress protein [bacterium]|nr:universal stress protein [bacterium]